MDSGVKASVAEGAGLKFTNCFSYSDCLLLVQVLHKNFGLKATIQSTGVSSQYRIYIPKESAPRAATIRHPEGDESMVELRNIVGPFIIPPLASPCCGRRRGRNEI